MWLHVALVASQTFKQSTVLSLVTHVSSQQRTHTHTAYSQVVCSSLSDPDAHAVLKQAPHA